MGPSAWATRYRQLADIRARPPRRAYVAQTHPDSGLRDWLSHQKALKKLGEHGLAVCVHHQTAVRVRSMWPLLGRASTLTCPILLLTAVGMVRHGRSVSAHAGRWVSEPTHRNVCAKFSF